MKRSKRTIAWFVLAALLLAGLTWRLLPHSFSEVLSADPGDLSELTCTATIGGVSKGQPFIDFYSMPTLAPEDKDFSEILRILERTRYRSDLRNLLPFPISTVNTDGPLRSAYVSVRWGDAPEQTCHISYHGRNLIHVRRGGTDASDLYHPTDPAAFNSLVEYVLLHGDRT